jgi:hypothetical protein
VEQVSGRIPWLPSHPSPEGTQLLKHQSCYDQYRMEIAPCKLGWYKLMLVVIWGHEVVVSL